MSLCRTTELHVVQGIYYIICFKDIHGELEKISRGEDRYLALVTQEHQVLKVSTFFRKSE
jgi:hypothetical protein